MRKFGDHAFDWIVWVMFAAVPAVIFWQAATSLEEQGAASGGPMVNAAFYPRIVVWTMLGLVVWLALRLVQGRVRRKEPGWPSWRRLC
ncbi:MAG: hypothetical protein RBS99_11445 [Rhodospirillales bacterium]|jgi:hypothetical protein|nr:hypothetical protein [Rhodospirillales bacterium]